MSGRKDNTFFRIPFKPWTLLFLLQGILLVFALSCSKKEVKQEGPFEPEASFARANELIEKKEYEEARRALLEIKNRDFSKKYAPLAQLKIGDTYVREEEFDLAIEEYRRFLDLYPEHSNASYAQYQIAMTYFGQIEGSERGLGAAAKALEEFEKLKRRFPRNPYREIVELRIEQCRNVIADNEYQVGEFYFKKGSYRAALGRFQRVLTQFPDYKKEPQVLYHTIQSYKRLDDKEKALEYFDRLKAKYPDDKLTREAQKEFGPAAR